MCAWGGEIVKVCYNIIPTPKQFISDVNTRFKQQGISKCVSTIYPCNYLDNTEIRGALCNTENYTWS